MLADYHLHTPLCKHAEGNPAEYVSAAIEAGLDAVAFCDHAPAPDGYDLRHRMTLDEFPTYLEMVGAVQDRPELRVLCGIEADYYEGCEAFLGPWLAGQDFDLVLGSIHFIRDWGFDHPDGIPVWESTNVADAWRDYFAILTRLADSRLYDVAAHPDLPKKFGHRTDETTLGEIAAPALDAIATAGMALELNTCGLRRPADEIYPSLALLSMAHERGIPACFGSDAHSPVEVGFAFDQAAELAREAGYTHWARFEQREYTLVPLD